MLLSHHNYAVSLLHSLNSRAERSAPSTTENGSRKQQVDMASHRNSLGSNSEDGVQYPDVKSTMAVWRSKLKLLIGCLAYEE